ncbi:DUF1793-domain-containing protein [Wolfiporia cocos MD-104 SS10]|uniref:DUF1793-domain-containing protein n=1 Tax=Wolfiporia cocos (strain MD-104) TaxID=742152 RepID=A0A2H3JQ34_WOLCO|nr:DUF1793-domain-containing protein [Wolfiporia cocos MD-104 SS10]
MALILEWTGHVQVDGFTYKWMGTYGGNVVASATLLETTITPTRTIMAFKAGAMNLTPADWIKQSMPFSYVSVSAKSNDGKPHNFQVFSHLSLRQLDFSSALENTSMTTPSPVDAQPFTDVNQQATDGTLYFTVSNTSGFTSYAVGGYSAVDSYFIDHGNLSDTDAIANASSGSLSLGPNVNVLALAASQGTISSTQDPVVFTVGYVRDPSVNYTSAPGKSRTYSPYFVTQSLDMLEIVEDFASDYTDVLMRAEAFDNSLMNNASLISTQYMDILALAARQIFGALDITVPSDLSDGWSADDVRIFMKDMGSSQRVNPVEQLYAAFPAFLCVNASLGRPLLALLFESQDVASNMLPYAAQDIGTAYPNATSDLASHNRGVEQSGNMLIMTLAHARYSGDGSLISTYYDRLRMWADYLTQNTLTFTGQSDADWQNAANMTNLAVKGIIGIYAMSEMSRLMGNGSDATRYASTAMTFMHEWEALAFAGNASHMPFSYGGGERSWVLAYNLYADLLLGTELVSQEIYRMQTEFYQLLIGPDLAENYGLPISSITQDLGSSAWLSFIAASAQNQTVRQDLLALLWAHASYNHSAGVFPALYNVSTGAVAGGIASPALGAVFAPLALNLSNKTIVLNGSARHTGSQHSGSASTDAHSHSNVGAIAGGVVGGVGVGVFIFVLVAFLLSRRRLPRNRGTNETDLYACTPFGGGNMAMSTSARVRPVSFHARTDLAYEEVRDLPPSKVRHGDHVWVAPAPSTTNAPSLSIEPPSTSEAGRTAKALRKQVERLLRIVETMERGGSGSELGTLYSRSAES